MVGVFHATSIRMRRIYLICIALCVLAGGVWADDVRVIGNNVNLRARPDLQAEVVGQVDRGTILQRKSDTDAWVEVIPPDHIEFWVHRDFIETGEVAAPRLNVRSGPGINYSVVTTIERGTRVREREQFSDWIGIDAPAGASVWITSDLVEPFGPAPTPQPEPAPLPPPAPEPEPIQQPEPEPATPVVERAPAPPPRELDLIPLAGQGEQVIREGVLRPAGFVFGRPSRYRLTRQRGHTIETICYIKGNKAQIQSLLGHDLKIEGREYWVQGARYPVLIPEKIVLKSPSS